MQLHHQHLRKRGWTGREIKHTERILAKAHHAKHPAYRILERSLFWALLAVLSIAVFSVSLIVWPAAIVLPTGVLALALLLLGLCLSLLFIVVLHDLDTIDRRHHVLAAVALPVVALVTVNVLIQQLQTISAVLNISLGTSGLTLGGIYAAGLLTPYLTYLWTVRA